MTALVDVSDDPPTTDTIRGGLKSCPFCGSDDVYIGHDLIFHSYEPGCAHCGITIGSYTSERVARHMWNTRAEAA